MSDNFYETLGVPQNATPAQIRVAFRRLVLQHHPDRSGVKTDVEVFVRITQAHEVLSDPDRRREYDRLLELRVQRARSPSARPAPNVGASRPAPPRTSPAIADELRRLVWLYARGSFFEAEKLARQILVRDARQSTPYAILGDLARNRGDLGEAIRLYAYAVQMEPQNLAYQRKHDDLVAQMNRTKPTPLRYASQGLGPTIAFGLIPFGCFYVVLAREAAAFPGLAWISTWTLGLVVMLFLSGVALGVGVSLAQYVDRFEALSSNALNRVSPSLALASIAIVNFWAAALVFGIVGYRTRSHTVSTSRLLGGVAAVVGLMALGAAGSARIDPLQVFIWGGNLVYVGAVCGWMVTDSLQS